MSNEFDFIVIDKETSGRYPAYKLRMLVNYDGIYVYPEILRLTELIAALCYGKFEKGIIDFKGHLYLNLNTVLEDILTTSMKSAARLLKDTIMNNIDYEKTLIDLDNLNKG